jgi:hypothetical protein
MWKKERGMAERIRIISGEIVAEAHMGDTATAKAIAEALPFESKANRWGEEIYFSIPVERELEEGARDVVECGELGYWPPGRALCIFFGPTPMSGPGEIRAASPVAIVGRIEDDARIFAGVRSGDPVRVEKA